MMQEDGAANRKAITRFIERMPSLSTTVGKVMEICSRTDASPNELNRVISLDPVLTGQVLKLINSAYYSLVNKVTSLTRAITMLGMNTVKNMALSTAIIRSVSGAKKSQSLPTKKFWAHSIATGVCAKLLAKANGVPVMECEEYFVAGLLHDLGKIPFGDEYIDVLNRVKKECLPLITVERDMLGVDHQEVGRMIAEKWKLNEAMTCSIAFHHDVEEAPEEHRVRAAYVGLANMYANILDLGYAGDPFPAEDGADKMLKITGLTWDMFGEVALGVEEEIEKAQVFLQS
ncbi:putative signal transduction protein [Desulfocapsa sulfexigens DSM 10523]|uniref:Putative signal transduction protein n=1 Tax=Desulfocapsa sulfexigens (strain DSM 10523 / SB164P1) TaxID=1167006 RepID=M1P5A3_DESSD|nr:HDOD domain-containing protein [Desulfocapsa sulfexigens]AGF76877.1 putative signal transduction protein [Desulfocapsa sulfexigens DSM 10523]